MKLKELAAIAKEHLGEKFDAEKYIGGFEHYYRETTEFKGELLNTGGIIVTGKCSGKPGDREIRIKEIRGRDLSVEGTILRGTANRLVEGYDDGFKIEMGGSIGASTVHYRVRTSVPDEEYLSDESVKLALGSVIEVSDRLKRTIKVEEERILEASRKV